MAAHACLPRQRILRGDPHPDALYMWERLRFRVAACP